MAFVAMGVPDGLAKDGWWLEDSAAVVGEAPRPRRWVGLLGLLALSDLLFWQQAGPGLSLAVFMATLARVAAPVWRKWPLVGLGLGVLPLVETVQALSVLFGVGAVVGFVIFHALQGDAGARQVVRAALRFVARAPWIAGRDAISGVRGFGGITQNRNRYVRALRALALPLGLGLVFASLLLGANPVLEGWAFDALRGVPDLSDLILRGLFWGGMALLIWPLLVVAGEVSVLKPAVGAGVARGPRNLSFGLVTAQSVTTSLILFNAMFALQTGLDLTYLWSGAALPVGMSHAEYAHRGAYPLVATALLAGGFALIARPFAAESLMVRGLFMAWVGQNVALVMSSLYRLDMYVGEYGLTYLRVYAGIWMVLVAVWLGLIAVQVARGLASGWLVNWSVGLGAGTLYLCCFVNFAGVIMDHNLTASVEGRLPKGLDARYLCDLGPDAWAAMVQGQAKGAALDCSVTESGWETGYRDLTPPRIEGWRDWSYRSWRVLRAGKAIGGIDANSGRG
jgi:Domain of unknown function (DUF4173)